MLMRLLMAMARMAAQYASGAAILSRLRHAVHSDQPTSSSIASGVFTAAGVDHESSTGNTATFTFSNGTVSLTHSAGTGTQSLNPKTCLLTVNLHGTYKLTSGTGSYAGITGSGKYQLSILAIGARVGGKCSQSKPPLAWHQVINASGPVTLP